MIITTLTLLLVLLAFDALACCRTGQKTLETDLLATGFTNAEVIIFHPACRLIKLLKKAKITRLETFHRQNDTLRIGDIRFIATNFWLISLVIALIEFLKDLTSLFFYGLSNLIELICCQVHGSPTLISRYCFNEQTEWFGHQV